MKDTVDHQYKIALALSVFTILYNLLEGMLSIFFGTRGEVLTLFGFGLDSLIEVISGTGIYFMIQRIRKSEELNKSRPEILALRITGYSFYSLVVLLLLGSAIAAVNRHHPLTTLSGILISLVSIAVMLILARIKTAVGRKLDSKPIIADARCSMVCVYMSVIVLVSSFLYQLSHIAYLDVAGSVALSWFCYREGREAISAATDIRTSGCC